jgi:hypothetical protein
MRMILALTSRVEGVKRYMARCVPAFRVLLSEDMVVLTYPEKVEHMFYANVLVISSTSEYRTSSL